MIERGEKAGFPLGKQDQICKSTRAARPIFLRKPRAWDISGDEKVGAASVGGAQVIVEVASRSPAMRFLFLAQPWDGQADGETAEHPQDVSGFGRPNPASILVEDFIQAVVQCAFDLPVLALERLQITGGQRGQRATAD